MALANNVQWAGITLQTAGCDIAVANPIAIRLSSKCKPQPGVGILLIFFARLLKYLKGFFSIVSLPFSESLVDMAMLIIFAIVVKLQSFNHQSGVKINVSLHTFESFRLWIIVQ